MSLTICGRCGELRTPWGYSNILSENICIDCYDETQKKILTLFGTEDHPPITIECPREIPGKIQLRVEGRSVRVDRERFVRCILNTYFSEI